jgi:excisionase family DNA binding protein
MRKIPTNDDFMTTREVGEALGVAVRTVQLWVESGVLPAWRTAGKHRRISRSAVEKLMGERSQVLVPTLTIAQPGTPAKSTFKIVVVEDDPDLLNLFKLTVEGWDFPLSLSTASNGFEGLVRIGQMLPDMVVTDLNMPKMDGFELVRALKKPGSGLESMHVVVLTALSNDEIKFKGGLPADVPVFQKPVQFGKLQALARKLASQLPGKAARK